MSVPWGVVDVSVSVGISIAGGGVYASVPDTVNYYIAKIDKNMKIQHRKVDVYQYNEYKYTYYTSSSTVESEDVYVVRA